jgi:tRNA(Ile)-lysidine synthase TilS/MesJ
MKICCKCVLGSNYPGIRFNGEGVCNYCERDVPSDNDPNSKKEIEEKFQEIIKKVKNKQTYDCLLAYSGGKDSTYALDLLKNRYGLNVLAVSFDNWYQSKWAQENIKNVIRNVKVDHITLRPQYDIFNKLIHLSVNNDLYSPKSLERTSAICNTCISLIRYSCIRITIEKGIPLLVFALSPGQAPLKTSIFKMNPNMVRGMQEVVFQPFFNYIGQKIQAYFLEERQFLNGHPFPYSINLLAFQYYEEKEILERIKVLGWQRPDDTDQNSTNCLLNAFANRHHYKKYGYHPYAYEISNLVRRGLMSREDGLLKLANEGDEKVINMVQRRLEMA